MAASRVVICQDAVKYLRLHDGCLPGSVITSLPDISECSGLGSKAAWSEWFVSTCTLILSKLADTEHAIFYQTDVRHNGEWVDKSYLCSKAAEAAGCTLLWRKILISGRVAQQPTRIGRIRAKASFATLLCYCKPSTPASAALDQWPDVVDMGDKIWSKGCGCNGMVIAVDFCKAAGTKLIIDPFCGKGSVLAVAGQRGLDSIGVELSPARCGNARNLQFVDGQFSWRQPVTGAGESPEANGNPGKDEEGDKVDADF